MAHGVIPRRGRVVSPHPGAAGALAAAEPLESLLRPLTWRSIGPFRGGRVLAVNGAVWETHDAGRTWTPIFDSAPVGSIGVWAPPGEYRVELQPGGRSYRAPLLIVADPRVKRPPAAYARQFALARDIEAARVEIAAALTQAERIHAAIGAPRQGAPSAVAASLASADAPPSVDAERGYGRHRAPLDEALAKWREFSGSALPRLNTLLQSAGTAAITP